MAIRETIASTPLIDNHAHPVTELPADSIVDQFHTWFTEGDLAPADARHTLNYRAALGVLADRFEEPRDDPDALLARRSDVDLRAYTRACLESTRTTAIIVDDGFPEMSPETFREYTDAAVYPLLRLEPVLEQLIDTAETFRAFETAFENRVRKALEGEYIGLKSIVAYRRGLAIEPPDRAAARRGFATLESGWDGRLEQPALLDFAIHRACELAAEYDVPIQFHTGMGDPDAHPRAVDPTHLVGCIEAHPETKIVVLHAGYPYVGQAGYMTGTYRNVYLDLSLSIPFAQHGAGRILSTAMELAPTTKLLYGSDGFSTPELFVMAANRFRAGLADVLEDLIATGIIDAGYGETVAANMMGENARRLYGIDP